MNITRLEQSGIRPDQQQAYGGGKYGWQHFFEVLERLPGGLE